MEVKAMALHSTLSLIILTLASLYILAAASSSDGSALPKTFIVHVSRSHKPSLFSTHHHWYTSIIQSLPPSPKPAKLLYTYQYTANGFSATLTPSQAAALGRVNGVLSIVPDLSRELHTTRTHHFMGLADGSGLWPNSDYADDVVVGVLDTGIWPERPSFSDAGLGPVPRGWKGICETSKDFPATACNGKIIGAMAFYKGYVAALGKPIDETKESNSPRDTEGHGTHTASTAAGATVTNASFYGYAPGTARGMASKARIAAYKICWSLGCFDSDILAAMDRAVSDGVHVISLSVGASGHSPPYYKDSIAIGSFGAMQNGVVVSCSAGNSGPNPYTATNIAPWILTVGASTIDREFPADAVLGDGRVFRGVSLYAGEPFDESTQLPMVYAGDCGDRYCYMGKLQQERVSGKIVVCDRGGNARVEKGAAVKLAGGVGMILANLADSGEELLADSHLIPATMVGQTYGDKIKEYLKSTQNPTATIKFLGTVIGSDPAAPKVASFSSRGPNSLTEAILKPDVIAPGVNILAGWTGFSAPTDLEIDPRRTEFNIISGTSMSCPHVSGIAALLRKAYPSWSPAAIKSALMTTARHVDNSGETFKDLATGNNSTSFVHGAGHVDPNSALDPGLIYDLDASDHVGFLCSIGYDAKKISVFVRQPTGSDVCDKTTVGVGALNYPSFSVVFDPKDEVVKYKRVVTNVGRNIDAVYEVKTSGPKDVEIEVSPKRLEFSAENQTLPYEVTFSKKVSGLRSAASVSSRIAWVDEGSIEWSDGTHRVRSPVGFIAWLSSSLASE